MKRWLFTCSDDIRNLHQWNQCEKQHFRHNHKYNHRRRRPHRRHRRHVVVVGIVVVVNILVVADAVTVMPIQVSALI